MHRITFANHSFAGLLTDAPPREAAEVPRGRRQLSLSSSSTPGNLCLSVSVCVCVMTARFLMVELLIQDEEEEDEDPRSFSPAELKGDSFPGLKFHTRFLIKTQVNKAHELRVLVWLQMIREILVVPRALTMMAKLEVGNGG